MNAQSPSASSAPSAPPAPSTRAPARSRLHVGPITVTPVRVLVVVVLIGALAYLGYVVAAIRDQQIPLLGAGFAALGASLAAIGIDALTGMWRAAARAEGGRAFGLAIVGGLAGLGAIGSFTATALSMLLWNS